MEPATPSAGYRGRLAPSPTGYLHLGHGRTFVQAWARCRQAGGSLVLRIEDLDPERCKREYIDSAEEDLRWLGLTTEATPVFRQSERGAHYLEAWNRLREAGLIYPSAHSRKDVARAARAPHASEEREPIFPVGLRPSAGAGREATDPVGVNWRFRVPDGRVIRFHDLVAGPQAFTAGEDFGDFLVYRKDGVPAYELAVVVDDQAMGITEVVRGEDLLLSTARQILLYEALGAAAPSWVHLPLMLDAQGRRMAKRHGSETLRALRLRGEDPTRWVRAWSAPIGR